MITPKDMISGFTHKSKRFGELEIVNYSKRGRIVTVKFLATGYQTTSTAHKIRMDKVADKMHQSIYGAGCIGDGRHKTTSRHWARWRDMLQRCYDESLREKYRSLIGWSVCGEWLNFQNFAEWADSNVGKNESYRLKVSKRNNDEKVYSPSTCTITLVG